MTQLTITPKISDKTARFKGTIAAGEHVAVTIKGGAEWIGTDNGVNLTLRVLDLVTWRTLAVFPYWTEDNQEDWPDDVTSADAWETSGDDNADLSCTLNLNTLRMVAAARHMLRVPVMFVLGDTDEPRTLYFRDRYEVEYWPERIGDTTPYDLDKWPKQIDEWAEQVAAWTSRMDNLALDAERTPASGGDPGFVTITLNDGTLDTDKTVTVYDGEVSAEQLQDAVDELEGAIADKQDALTFDDAPTANSANPVKSCGVKTAIDTVATNLSTHTGNSGIHVTADQKSAWTAKYAKPSGGIPKTDLAAGVQASLSLADSALQSHQDISGKVNSSDLFSDGKIKSSLLPSYVDDVEEYSSTSAFPATGETSKIYVAKDTNKVYRWGGSGYVEISPAPDLSAYAKTADLATVATSGSYNDLTDKPTIPAPVDIGGKLDGMAAYPAWLQTPPYPYAVGQKVSSHGLIWKCTEAGTTDEPGVSEFGWEEVTIGSLLFDKQDALTSAQLANLAAVPNKADKVSGATAGNLASLTAQGNLADSGAKASDFATPADLPYRLVEPGVAYELSAATSPITYYDGEAYVAVDTVVEPIESGGGITGYMLKVNDEVGTDIASYTADGAFVQWETSGWIVGDGEYADPQIALTGHLLDRANNLIDATSGNVTLTLPEYQAGKLRDLLVYVDLGDDGTDPYSITFNFPSGESNTGFKAEGDDPTSATFPAPTAAGEWWYSFTECKPHKFAVSLKQLQDAPQAQGGS